ncbi:MAG: HupE/UreJ family protein [Myxococcota bacterium]
MVSVRLKLLELSRMGPEALPPGSVPGAQPPGAPDLPARSFPQDLIMLANERPCAPSPSASRRPDEAGWVRYEWRVDCPTEGARLAIRSRILLDVAPSHMHFARARFTSTSAQGSHSEDGDVADIPGPSAGLREQVLTEAAPEFVLQEVGEDGSKKPKHSGSGILDYIQLGVEHILSGWDHLAFVFGLLLLASRFGEVARLITGFTLAHSLTLALAVLGWVHPRAAAVEAVIAFSVALVAVEIAWQNAGRPKHLPRVVQAFLVALGIAAFAGVLDLPLMTIAGLLIFSSCYFALISGRPENESGGWLRICLTFAFGLVHGFGFAGILMEMSLPTDRLVPALLGFNVGVELGQLGVVLLIWPLLILARRSLAASAVRFGTELSAAVLCGIGLYWLIERTLPF